MQNKKTRFLTEAAIVAALYVVLTLVSKPFMIGLVEVRISEALCILPYFMPSSVWGLFIGCLISNVFSGQLIDVIIGSLATLIGAFIASKIKIKWLCPLPTVLSNALLIPIVIMYCSNQWGVDVYLASAGGVFASEVASAYVLGMVLLLALEKTKIFKR